MIGQQSPTTTTTINTSPSPSPSPSTSPSTPPIPSPTGWLRSWISVVDREAPAVGHRVGRLGLVGPHTRGRRGSAPLGDISCGAVVNGNKCDFILWIPAWCATRRTRGRQDCSLTIFPATFLKENIACMPHGEFTSTANPWKVCSNLTPGSFLSQRSPRCLYVVCIEAYHFSQMKLVSSQPFP